MKELSIEEKAKAYDDAIDKIKYVMEHGVSPTLNKKDLQDIFPELKESEDEKIRKAIHIYLDWLDGRNKDYQPKGDYSIKDMIAWLEKQGEQKHVVIIPKFRIGDNIKTTNEEPLTITKIDDKGYWSEDLLVCDFDDAAKWELVERKPAWSEEDERRYRGLHNLIYSTQYCDSRKELSDWLKSIKQRIGG